MVDQTWYNTSRWDSSGCGYRFVSRSVHLCTFLHSHLPPNILPNSTCHFTSAHCWPALLLLKGPGSILFLPQLEDVPGFWFLSFTEHHFLHSYLRIGLHHFPKPRPSIPCFSGWDMVITQNYTPKPTPLIELLFFFSKVLELSNFIAYEFSKQFSFCFPDGSKGNSTEQVRYLSEKK